ncbi:hypothetical protein NEF87_002151 [Candidatus Lokiarchaeum ossiferum]|uniref:Periplasmic copper-binding protein NosD beta helix domain-containing protein n=1 Tax=Candidatus Lokiarchaeum ossiferum TaxID=2951803 RepID=A0ABY6HQS7_9ARCH|nr:hypothetical protein NEF87_002151 [Candidatus Lokiarchaeum sp. B-35]
MKTNQKIIFLSSLFLSIIIGSTINFGMVDVSADPIVGLHDTIFIDPTQDDMSWKDCPYVTGSGAKSNPYKLQNLIIDADESGSGIRIENSEKYVLIENCTITNSGYLAQDAGITLMRCDNVIIRNCTFIENYKGIYSAYGEFNQVLNCDFINNSRIGLYPYVSKNGIYSGNYICGSEQMGLYSHFSVGDTFQGNHIEFNFKGTVLFEGLEHKFSNNYIINSTSNGLEVYDTKNTTITQNKVMYNGHGIQVKETSSFNKIYYNIFSKNVGNQGYDDGSGINDWDNGTHGNFWGDYSTRYPSANSENGMWDIKYHISGSRNDDNFPLVEVPTLNLSYNAEVSTGIPGFNIPIMILYCVAVSVFLLVKRKIN